MSHLFISFMLFKVCAFAMVSADKPFANLFNPLGLDPLLSTGAWAAFSIGALYAGICLTLYQRQRKLIFRPLPTLLRTPAELGLPYEEVWIPIKNGGKLHGWWLPNPSPQSPSQEKPVLLFCHGNYGNISYNTERIRFFCSLGFSVFAFDYRGYGQSIDGANADAAEAVPIPSEKSTYADAESAWRYLTEKRGISPHQITTLGHSMGGAVAIHLATQPIAKEMARLIVASSFTTMEDTVRSKPIYTLFPIQQLLTEPFNSLSRVPSLPMPVLYVHGDQDFDVPMPMSQQLYEASSDPKRLWIAPGAGHNDICLEHSDRYADVIQSFCTLSADSPISKNTTAPTPSAV